jgi:subtilase family serine protease
MRLRPLAFVRHALILGLLLLGFATLTTGPRFAATAVQDRVGEIDNNSIAAIPGNVRGKAQRRYDQGPVEGSFKLENVIMAFKPAPAQQAALDQLLGEQLDRSSPNYHRWLTPEQFAGRFGLTEGDLDRVVSWLKGQGFSINLTARSRTWVSFSGTADEITAAFHTEIHRYAVNGETHYANATDPFVPSALADVVLALRSLDDFRPNPRAARGLRTVAARPEFTSSISGDHFLAPDDFATIYGLQGLYNSGIEGSGEKIVVIGQTDFQLSDIQAFRAAAGLGANNPAVLLMPGSPDPGTVAGNLVEADLDLEWSGGLAPDASILYVNSDNAFSGLQYAIDEDLAPVLTVSYGDCEADAGAAFADSLANSAKQANAQGMTMVSASGDDGAADCDEGTPTSPPTIATHGLAVDIPAAIPYFTGVGGTEFNEGSETYWSSTNNAYMGSALRYIPETAWNETANDGSLAAGGGGASTLFSKPSWQTGAGVPADGKRDVPDVSFNASAGHDPYLICTSGSCVNGFRAADNTLQVVGGTSAGAPSFAAVVALIDQRQKGAQGNVNPTLYAVAAKSSDAFHDVTTGNNMVPCEPGSLDCPGSGEMGYSAGPGYDLASGLGSIDAYNLAADWSSAPPPPDFQISISPASVTVNSGATATATVTITGLNGFSGAVNFTLGVPATLAGVTAAASPSTVTGTGAATLTITAAPGASLQVPGRFHDPGPWTTLALLLSGLGFGVIVLRSRGPRPVLASRGPVQTRLGMALALGCLLAAAISCGGGGSTSPTTPTTTSTAPQPVTADVTVQATSGSLSHSASVSVTLN